MDKLEEGIYLKTVVSSGHFHAFCVIFVPLDYIPTEPPHSTYVKVSGVILSIFAMKNKPF